MSEMVDPMRGMSEIVEWLRPLIEGDKALAHAALMAPVDDAPELESTYPNGNFRLGIWWAVQDRHEDDGPLRLVKAQIYEGEDANPTYTLPAPHIVSGGSWEAYPEAILQHIATHDPRDTIARCEADLALLDRCELVIKANEIRDRDERGHYVTNPIARKLARDTIRMLASGYRQRDGWKPEWG